MDPNNDFPVNKKVQLIATAVIFLLMVAFAVAISLPFPH